MRHFVAWVVIAGLFVDRPLLAQSVKTERVRQTYNCSDGRCYIASGTAIAWRHINGGTEFVTAAHVVDQGNSCTVGDRRATVTFRHRTDDVAIVFAAGYRAPKTIPITVKGPKLGETVHVYGLSSNEKQYRISGNVSSWQYGHDASNSPKRTVDFNVNESTANAFELRQTVNGRRKLIDTKIIGSMSGGPALVQRDGKWYVAGILSAGEAEGLTVARLRSLNRLRPSVARRVRSREKRLTQILDESGQLGNAMAAVQPQQHGELMYPGDKAAANDVVLGPSSTTPWQGETSGPWMCKNGRRVPYRCPPQQPAQVIVQGQQGPQGKQGPQGIQGRPGRNITAADATAIVHQVIAANPERFRGRDGRDVEITPEILNEIARQVVALIPPKPIVLAGKQVGVWDIRQPTIDINIPTRDTKTIDITSLDDKAILELAGRLQDKLPARGVTETVMAKRLAETVAELQSKVVPVVVFNSDGSRYSADDERKAFDPIEIELAEPEK